MTRRVGLVVLGLWCGCKPREVEPGLLVTVTFDPGLDSKCLQVEVRAGGASVNSAPVPLAGKSKVFVGVVQANFPATVEVRAIGFRDEGCRVAANEESQLASATFVKNEVTQVTVSLAKVAPKTERGLCDNGVDDDLDGALDCADVDCDAQPCVSVATCLEAQRCTNRVCGGGQVRICATPPSSCFAPVGVCQADDGGCQYTPVATAGCNDGDACTQTDRCAADGSCRGTLITCAQTANGCLAPSGSCLDGSCAFAPKVDAGCSDNDTCTVADRCDEQGRCAGARVTCSPSACQTFANRCLPNGTCVFDPVDAGTACDGGLCSLSGDCLPPFPFTPTNFAVVQLRAPPPLPTVLDCGETVIDTSGPVVRAPTNWCRGQPYQATLIKQDAGPDALLVSLSGLTLTSDAGLTLIGDKPVILAVLGDVSLTGPITARAGALVCSAGLGGDGSSNLVSGNAGGGGSGFITAGGAGGVGGSGVIPVAAGAAGSAEPAVGLSPLRGGCAGGRGGDQSTPRTAGGGAVQISAAGVLSINAVISAPGRGGAGGGGGLAFGKGGNGGGSGGMVLLEASQLVISGGAVTANGGAGGEGGGIGRSGDDGADGPARSADPAAGGTGGSLIGGAGGRGGAANGAPGTGTSAVSAGGGGGSVGQVFLRGAASCSVGPQVIVSPAAPGDAGCP